MLSSYIAQRLSTEGIDVKRQVIHFAVVQVLNELLIRSAQSP